MLLEESTHDDRTLAARLRFAVERQRSLSFARVLYPSSPGEHHSFLLYIYTSINSRSDLLVF